MLAIDEDILKQLDDWYQKPLGQALSEVVQEELAEHLDNIFGYYIVQLGLPQQRHWMDASPIPHKFCVSPYAESLRTDIQAAYTALPFDTGSVDLVLLPHILGFLPEPQAVLAEADRILVNQGYLVILGFNPMSLWGAARWFARYKGSVPWHGHFLTTFQLRKYLLPLGYDATVVHSFFQRPPFEWALDKLLFLETMGHLSGLYPGGAYLLLAQKQTVGVTPVKLKWRLKQTLLGHLGIE